MDVPNPNLGGINRSPIGETEFNGVKTTGNPSTFFGPAVVAFVDLLGFSASIKTSWNDPQVAPLERLLRIKQTAEKSRDTTIAIAADWSSAPPKVKQAFRSRIQTVSDSIVVCNALSEQTPQIELAFNLSALFFSVQVLWEAAVNEGYTIRGAVECGEIYWTPSETVGPAFIDAYALEKNCAKCSRVIVGPLLLRAISQLGGPQLAQVQNFLAISEDGLVEVRPIRLSSAETISRLEMMAAKAGPSREKYAPLLSLIREGNRPPQPTHADFDRAASALSAR